MIRRLLLTGVVVMLAGSTVSAKGLFGFGIYLGPGCGYSSGTSSTSIYGPGFSAGVGSSYSSYGCRGPFVPFGTYAPFSSFSVVYAPPPPIVYQPIYQPVYQPVFVGGINPFAAGPFPAPGGFQQPPAANVPPPKQAQAPPPKPKEEPKPKDELVQQADAQRLIRAGNEAFAAGNYLLASRKYEQAMTAAPTEPMAYFHLAQAYFALGKYDEANVAIQRGMRFHKDWPVVEFQPRLLYGDRANEMKQHLKALADVVGKNLNDDSMLFLLGYQLWFDGQRDEAAVLLRRAAALARDSTHIDRFLKAGVALAGR